MSSLIADNEAVTLEGGGVHPDISLALGLSGPGKRISKFPRVLSLLSTVLETSVKKNEFLVSPMKMKEAVTIFQGLRAPNLSIKMYIERIFKYSKCSPSCFVLAHIYIDRFLQKSDIHLTSLNVHRLLITSAVVAAKFIDDGFFNNAYYARVGGISTAEMNKLELNFLFGLDFRLGVSVASFEKCCLELENKVSGYRIERPIQICGSKDCRDVKEKNQPLIQAYSCGAV